MIRQMGLFRLQGQLENALSLYDAVVRAGICKNPDGPFSSFVKSKEDLSDPLIGQLSIKEEAAGKVRVFALVDIWTQSVCKPIHDALFSFLKTLPNDATFDQTLAVQRCIEKSNQGHGSYGYDLSAATDRLPISIQVQILGAFLGLPVAKAWAKLLVDRDYTLNSKEYGTHSVRYSVGQPMGALSS